MGWQSFNRTVSPMMRSPGPQAALGGAARERRRPRSGIYVRYVPRVLRMG